MPADNPPRRITIHKAPYNFEHSRSCVECWKLPGEYLVPGHIADHATASGYATEGWAPNSRTRTVKGGPKRKRATGKRKSVTTKADAETITTDGGSDAGLAGTGVSADDSSTVRGTVDQSAE